MSLNPGTRVGVYEILAPLGAGGMGEVYRARDTRLDRIVAIKVLAAHATDDPVFRERFDREARVISQLNHPHICTLHDVGSEGGAPYLVLEYLDGETLAARLTRGPLSIPSALAIGIQICDALDKAHRQGIVHRDLKPGNVMLVGKGPTPQVKLLDFGLAKSAGPAMSGAAAGAVTVSTPMTTPGMLLGTLPYMAPEQAEGREADARSDIFAFGAVMHEMVSGQRAFDGKSAASVIAAVLERHPAPLSTLQALTPPALDHIVARCLAKDPDERWQSAGDVMRELQWVAGAPAASAPGQTVSRARERVWMTIAGALAIALAVLAVGLFRAPTTTPAAQALQTSLLPPEHVTWAEIGAVSISPDGRQVVFVARGADEGPSLWLRSLDRAEARKLEGTERGEYPFWSADSRHIGFFVPGQLKRIPLDGGPARIVCSVAEGFGGTWNGNDVILFASNGSAIFRVPASGGDPVQLTKPPPPEGFHAWPVFLPDGEHFLFVGRTRDPKSMDDWPLDLYAASLHAPEGTVIGKVGSNVAFAAPGQLLFLLRTRRIGERTLVAQRFDPDHMQLVGDPQPLAADLGFTSYASRAVFSVSSTGTLIYRADPPRDHALVWFDRTGRRLGALAGPGRYFDPALSPDGKTVSVTLEDPSTRTTDIWFLNVARPVPVRFTHGPGGHRAPVWSPDSTRVAFQAYRPSGIAIYAKSVTSEAEQQLTAPEDGFLLPTDWSADGRTIITELRERTLDIVKVPVSGGEKPTPVLATSFHEGSATLSPDGRWVAYQSDESGRNEVYVRRLDRSGARQPVSAGPGGGFDPQWRRDGKELFYLTTRPSTQLMAVDVRMGDAFTSGAPHALFDITLGRGGDRNNYAVTPDGQRFLAVTPVVSDPVLPITVVTNWIARVQP